MRPKYPLPPALLLMEIILLVVVHFLSRRFRLISFPANLAGLIPLAAGGYLNLAADRLLKRHRTTVKPFQDSAALVTTGVYSRTRNPMYLGFVLISLGIALLLGSAGPFLIVPVFAWLLNRLYIRVEEAMMREKFGQEWVAYQRRVRKWL